MEDKKQQQKSLSNQYPSILSTDDLIFELGKITVDRLNKELILNKVIEKNKELEETIKTLQIENEKLMDDLKASKQIPTESE